MKTENGFFDPENCQKDLLRGPNFDLKFFELTIHLKGGLSRLKNDAQTTSEQLQTNFQKVQKTGFLALKMVKMTLSEDHILTKNFNFRGQISTFKAKNRDEIRPYKARNNA